jgi:hypothetical protein
VIDKQKIVKILQGQYNTLRNLSMEAEDRADVINIICEKCKEYGIDYREILLGTPAYQRAKEFGQIQ